jgi:hypothetical protein
LYVKIGLMSVEMEAARKTQFGQKWSDVLRAAGYDQPRLPNVRRPRFPRDFPGSSHPRGMQQFDKESGH